MLFQWLSHIKTTTQYYGRRQVERDYQTKKKVCHVLANKGEEKKFLEKKGKSNSSL